MHVSAALRLAHNSRLVWRYNYVMAFYFSCETNNQETMSYVILFESVGYFHQPEYRK